MATGASSPSSILVLRIDDFITGVDRAYAFDLDQEGSIPITHDPGSGALSFALPATQGVPPGVYQMEAFVAYQGDDTISRMYTWQFDRVTLHGSARVPIQVSGTFSGSVVLLEPVYLEPPGTVCPA